jgi:choline monooxygenase
MPHGLKSLCREMVRHFDRHRHQINGGIIWLCLSDDTPDLKSFLGDIHGELDWFGLDKFDTRFRAQFTLNANWKTVVDAFNETWLVPHTHHATLSEIVQWGKAHLRICNPHSWMSIPVKGPD